jgi:DnaJ homolog subfamily C member 28
VDPEVISKVAERKIQEAIEEGQFDNLPGKGKPLVFDDDPMTPPHLRLANRILKNANVLPEWMQVQKDLQAERQEITQVRERVGREYITRRAKLETSPTPRAPQQFADWRAQVRADFLRRLKSVNTGILKLNLMAPSTVQPGIPYKIEAEMAAFDTEFPPLEGVTPSASLPSQTSESQIRGVARARYETNSGAVRGD